MEEVAIVWPRCDSSFLFTTSSIMLKDVTHKLEADIRLYVKTCCLSIVRYMAILESHEVIAEANVDKGDNPHQKVRIAEIDRTAH